MLNSLKVAGPTRLPPGLVRHHYTAEGTGMSLEDNEPVGYTKRQNGSFPDFQARLTMIGPIYISG